MVRLAAVALLLVLTFAVLPAFAPGAAATESGPKITRLSFDPVAGDYTLLLRVDNFHLVPVNASANSTAGQGHIEYYLNSAPCVAACSNGADYRTNLTHFTYHRLVTGDLIFAVLALNNGTVFEPAVFTYALVSSSDARCVEPGPGKTCLRMGSIGPFLAITSPRPNAGDYRMQLLVDRFNLVDPGAGAADEVSTGYIVYTRNGEPCVDACSGGVAAATAEKSFLFHGVKTGDRLGAHLLRVDGQQLEPKVAATVTVTAPSITLISGVPQEGAYTLRVNVVGFTLQPAGSPSNAGTGHILYLIKPKGAAEFAPPTPGAECQQNPQTAATSFRFCDLVEGDQVTAELVADNGAHFSPRVLAPTALEVHKQPQEPLLTPAIGPLVGLLVLGLAAGRRPR